MTQQKAQKVVIFLPDDLYGEVMREARQAHPLRSVGTQVAKIVEQHYVALALRDLRLFDFGGREGAAQVASSK